MADIRARYLDDPPQQPPSPGSEAWCASKLGSLARTLAKYRTLTGNTKYDDLLARDYGGPTFPRSGDDRDLVRHLRDSAESMRVNFPGYTSEVRWTDRVLRFPALFGKNMMFRERIDGVKTPDPQLIYSLVTGDPGSGGYFPMNAVRWRTPPREIAALVTESANDRFCAELYHFGKQRRIMSADLYLLAKNSYEVTVCRLEGRTRRETPLQQSRLDVRGPNTRLEIELPPRQLVELRIEAR